MLRIKTKQIFDLNSFKDLIDYFICCSGYESRAINIATKTRKIKIQNKFTFNFNDNINEIRIGNDKYFLENGFRPFKVDGNSFRSVRNILKDVFKEAGVESKSEFNILIDYSCMTRIMYGEIIYYFKYHVKKGQTINIYFAYTKAFYDPPSEENIYNTHVDPIIGFSDLTIPERPTALIIGLGYEKNRAYSLKEYLDAEKVFLFISQSEMEPKFEKSVLKENEELIERSDKNNLFFYPIDDLAYTEMVLERLTESLLKDYRVVFAPCGPKPFTLLCFIIASKYNDVDVWRVSAGISAPPVDKKASEEILIYCLQMNDLSS